MKRDVRNLFHPFEHLPANHENQLTRALVVVLRLSPMAHIAWLRLLAPDLDPTDLPPAEWATQRRAVQVGADSEEEPVPLVSVFLAPERPVGEAVIGESDRGQVLDAVAEYPGRLVVVVENKIVEADDLQARELNFTGAQVQLEDGQTAVVVLWRDLLDRLGRLLEGGLVSGTESLVISDFLAYVEDNFGELGPFRTLGLCRGNRFRIDRRLRALLSGADDSVAISDAYGSYVPFLPESDAVAAKVYLWVPEDSESIELAIYPGDTLTQARQFYGRPELVERLRALTQREGWKAAPNFHFGHMQRGYVWTWGGIGVDEYLSLWRKRIERTGAVPREEWEEYWAWLCEAGVADPADKPEFDRHFTDTQRQTASPRPGVEIARYWTLDEAERLDASGELEVAVRSALTEAREALVHG